MLKRACFVRVSGPWPPSAMTPTGPHTTPGSRTAPYVSFQEVLAAAGAGARRSAIDFGCGIGVETRAMLTSGWRVLALDGEAGTRDRVLATTQGSAQERLTIETIRFPDLITGCGLGVRRVLPALHSPR